MTDNIEFTNNYFKPGSFHLKPFRPDPPGKILATSCGDCGVEPGTCHDSGCSLERCSVCGYQWIACGHSEHDPCFARWTGFYPGSLESQALGIDLNEFNNFTLPYTRLFFVKPPAPESYIPRPLI